MLANGLNSIHRYTTRTLSSVNSATVCGVLGTAIGLFRGHSEVLKEENSALLITPRFDVGIALTILSAPLTGFLAANVVANDRNFSYATAQKLTAFVSGLATSSGIILVSLAVDNAPVSTLVNGCAAVAGLYGAYSALQALEQGVPAHLQNRA